MATNSRQELGSKSSEVSVTRYTGWQSMLGLDLRPLRNSVIQVSRQLAVVYYYYGKTSESTLLRADFTAWQNIEVYFGLLNNYGLLMLFIYKEDSLASKVFL